MSILDSELLGQRYFFPRRVPLAQPFPVAAAPGVELQCYRERTLEDRRTLVYFHGNGSVVADLLPLCGDFDGLGLDCFLAEYRGYGTSTGVPGLARMLPDVEKIFQALCQPERELVVLGRSLGSIYALEFVSRHPEVAGLILESGIADVLERVLLRVDPGEIGTTREALEEECVRLFDHERKLAEYHRPLLVLHAQHDAVVDVSHAVRNHAWSRSPLKRLVLFPRGGHNDILAANREQYWAEIRDWLTCLR